MPIIRNIEVCTIVLFFNDIVKPRLRRSLLALFRYIYVCAICQSFYRFSKVLTSKQMVMPDEKGAGVQRGEGWDYREFDSEGMYR